MMLNPDFSLWPCGFLVFGLTVIVTEENLNLNIYDVYKRNAKYSEIYINVYMLYLYIACSFLSIFLL